MPESEEQSWAAWDLHNKGKCNPEECKFCKEEHLLNEKIKNKHDSK